MKTSHEWPLPAPALRSSSSKRKLTRESLASVDWQKACRFESYSDGDDELLHTQEPSETASQNYIGIQSYGNSKGVQGSSDSDCEGDKVHVSEGGVHQEIQRSDDLVHKGLQSSGYGDGKNLVVPSITPKIREGQTNFLADRRVKLVGKPHTVRFVDAALVAIQESGRLDSKDPISPEVTCLGRVRIKEKHGQETERVRLGCVRINKEKLHSYDTEQPRQAVERRKQTVDKNGKDGPHKSSSKRDSTEKRTCLRMRKTREDMELGKLKLFRTSSATIIPSETAMETRRERAAVLARSLTSLIEDLRCLDMENSGYVPVVPPSNSLLLMRGFGNLNKSSALLSGKDVSSADGILPHDVKTHRGTKLMQTSPENPNVFPLTEIKSNSLVQKALPFKSALNDEWLAMGKSCPPQELALWQRRAIAKLAAIDTNRPMRMEIKKPSTN